ncbi:MAG: lipopolysaccharide assembly protein LapA domain-containing protein [Sedimentisphaerales bacterium]
MKKVKIVIIITILLIALVVSLQNTEVVETKFLLATVTMPRVLLLLLTFTLGLVAGLITASIILRKPAKSKEKVKAEQS